MPMCLVESALMVKVKVKKDKQLLDDTAATSCQSTTISKSSIAGRFSILIFKANRKESKINMPVRPPKISSTTKPIDPLELLPNELFVLIFAFMCQLEIATTSLTNSKWRRILLSSPNLYSDLRLRLRPREEEPSEVARNERFAIMNQQIRTLIRGSHLAQNRIKHFHLDGDFFICEELRTIAGGRWASSRLSILFDQLYLSKDHLKSFEMVTHELDVSDVSVFENTCSMVGILLQNLKRFPALKEVSIVTSTLLDLTYQSDDKVLEIASRYGDTAELRLPPHTIGHRLLLENILDFFEGSFTKVTFDGGSMIDASIVEILKESKSSLEVLELYNATLQDCRQEAVELVTDCQNVTSLDVCFPDPISYERPRPGFFVSSQSNHVSKLTKVELSGVINLPWDRDSAFFRWLGTRLEHLQIDLTPRYYRKKLSKDEFLNQTSINIPLFTSFLRPLSSTLVHLYLRSVVMDPFSSGIGGEDYSSLPGDLSMETLEYVWVEGNIDLVNFFLKIKYSEKLENFKMNPYSSRKQYKQLDFNALKTFVKSYSQTLRTLGISQDSSQGYSEEGADLDTKLDFYLEQLTLKYDSSEEVEIIFQELDRLGYQS